jgi:hypothetical protein
VKGRRARRVANFTKTLPATEIMDAVHYCTSSARMRAALL